jgi:hypothetical protein
MANGSAPHATHKPHLVIFPGEQTDATGTTVGHIYVVGGTEVKKYEAVGGPPPGRGFHDRGGHTAGVTPAGHYVLDRKEHHESRNWPQSVVPWGAEIRDRDGIIEYHERGIWIKATGLSGTVTRAIIRFAVRSKKHIAPVEADHIARHMFYSDGKLISEWNKNDFGNWSWNLKKNGSRTVYYIHTTPENEAATAAGKTFVLEQSHGCVHIRPSDRDQMMADGVLKEGVHVEVKPYGQVGPPP